MNQSAAWLLAIPFFLSLSGCSTSIRDYQNEKPVLELNRFFNGELMAHGIVQNFSGKVIRRFSATISAQWEGDQGILDERFLFDDGEEQFRCWRLTKNGNYYTGVAGDVVGEAEGEAQGNTFNWRYTLKVPVAGKEWNIRLDDWLYLVDENNLINRTRMSKLGIPVGELTIFIRKLPQETPNSFNADCQLG